jgi:hypothetical protein
MMPLITRTPAARQALVEAVATAMQLKRTMDPIVRTKYAGNAAKLAAWASASAVAAG